MRSATTLLFLTSVTTLAQTPAFEVASIRAGQPGQEAIETGPASLTMRNVRLKACIPWAYDVQDFQIAGPGWVNDVWFDVFAKSSQEATSAQLRKMMQTLLAERFKLAVHRDSKEMSAYILTVGKNGHKLTPNETEGSPSFKTGKMNLTGQGATIGQLTEFLSRELKDPVLDQTGLTGRFNYFLDIGAFVTEEMQKNSNGGPPPEAGSIITIAMREQLGLKMEPKKTAVEMIIVDHVEKTPTDN